MKIALGIVAFLVLLVAGSGSRIAVAKDTSNTSSNAATA